MTCHPIIINLLYAWLLVKLSSSCHAITLHPAWYIWLVIIIFTGTLTCYSVSWSVTCFPALHAVTWLYSTYVLLNSWSCLFPVFSRKVIIKLMNPKMDQLVLGRGKHADIDMCSCLQWLLGVLCNPCSGLTCGPPGDRGEMLDPFISGTMQKGHT